MKFVTILKVSFYGPFYGHFYFSKLTKHYTCNITDYFSRLIAFVEQLFPKKFILGIKFILSYSRFSIFSVSHSFLFFDQETRTVLVSLFLHRRQSIPPVRKFPFPLFLVSISNTQTNTTSRRSLHGTLCLFVVLQRIFSAQWLHV